MTFQDLKVWRISKDLAIKTYRIVQDSKISKDFSLKDQIQRSSISVSSNIAEGYSRDTDKDRIHFLYIAKGSAAEFWTQIAIAKELALIEKSQGEQLLRESDSVQRMIAKLISALRSQP